MKTNSTKHKYIKELERKLRKMPQEESLDAVGFYKEYLVDTGVDTYREAVDKLGTPNKVAAQILSDYFMRDIGISHGEKVQKPHRSIWEILAAIFLGIIAVPIGIPLVLSVLLLMLFIIITIIFIILSILLIAMVFILSAVVFIGMSIPTFPVHVLTAFFILGTGIVCMGLGVLFLQLTIISTKSFYKGLVKVAKRLQQRRGGQYA